LESHSPISNPRGREQKWRGRKEPVVRLAKIAVGLLVGLYAAIQAVFFAMLLLGKHETIQLVASAALCSLATAISLSLVRSGFNTPNKSDGPRP
jgi:hypothetical protein